MILVTGGTIVTVNANRDVIENGAVLIDGDRIRQVGAALELEEAYPRAERLDARGKAVFPGLINTHTHLIQTLMKGLGDDKPLYNWIKEMTLPASIQATEEDSYIAALHGAVEAIRSGTTTLVDFAYSNHRRGLTEAVVKGLDEAGMRAVVARGLVTRGEELGVPRPLIERPDDALADCERLIKMHNRSDNRVQVGMAPCILWMVDEPTLMETRRLADHIGGIITIHLSETNFEVEQALKQYGRREVDVMNGMSFLGGDVLAVHCTKCNARDVRQMKVFDVKVSHNPCSNMYLASGVAPIPQMLMAGLTVGLATDGPASNNNQNMIHVLKYGALLHKVAHEDATIITAEKIVEMATIDGARAIGKEAQIGSLEPGKKADLVVMAFDNAHVTPVHNPVSALVYAALGNEPETVLIDGRIVMRDRVITTVDETTIRQEVQRAAVDLAERAHVSYLARRPWRSIGY
ncbi:MAG: amidohydrolase family protein [Armatimonadota bacterium]